MSFEDSNFKNRTSNIKNKRARGTDPEDDSSFGDESLERLKTAAQAVNWLLDRGYPLSAIIPFTGGHHQLTARQRLALQRSAASDTQCTKRAKALLPVERVSSGNINVDGFNLIITLEVALSGGILIYGRDGTLRDLAGLRGTYHLIDKTDIALDLIGEAVKKLKIPEATFWLDSPVSNSGRLKVRIAEFSEKWGIPVDIKIVQNPDVVLMKSDRVVTGDSVILDSCESWFNLGEYIVREYIPEARILNFYD